MDIELVNKLHDLYLMLVGGYVILAVGTITYIIEVYRFYKKQKAIREKIEQEILDKFEV